MSKDKGTMDKQAYLNIEDRSTVYFIIELMDSAVSVFTRQAQQSVTNEIKRTDINKTQRNKQTI